MAVRLKILWLFAAAVTLPLVAGALATEGAGANEPETHPCVIECEDPPQVEVPNHGMLMIEVGWTGGDPAIESPLASGVQEGYVGYFQNHVNEWFAQSAPGIFEKWQVVNGGSYLIAPPARPPQDDSDSFDMVETECSSAESGAFFEEVARAAEAKAREHGIEPGNYDRVVFHWQPTVCFGGIDLGRRLAVMKPEYAMHELGHSFGLEHANSLRCTGASGNLVPLSLNCTEAEYGDEFDAMGNEFTYRSYDAIHTNQLGWLNGQFVSLVGGDFTQTITLKPFTENPHGLRAIRLQDGGNTFWIEYRTQVGIESGEFSGHPVFFVEPGVLIHREVPTGGAPKSQLLDMTPGSLSSHDYDDARLPVGQTWTDPLGEMKITVNSQSSSGATVTISSQFVSVPNLVRDTESMAKSALEAAGLAFGGSNWFKDSSCEYIGVVKSQSPAAGTRVRQGTAVSVSIGEEDPRHRCP